MGDQQATYRFCFGPWNLSEGNDPFGPTVRPALELAEKLRRMQNAGYEGIMSHDDDVVPGIEGKSPAQIAQGIRQWKTITEDHGLVTEMVAPRLWEDARGTHGGFTSNDPAIRQWAIDRALRCADIAAEVGTDLFVLWLAREGTYFREAKNAIEAHHRLVEAMDRILEHSPNLRIAIEAKPNEPMDHAYLPTVGHALALGYQTKDPARVGAVIESAHSVLAGLDPSDDMAFALSADKLWSVHLNDQNSLKYDQDRAFGSVNLRAAFNQVRILEAAGYANKGMVAFDVKPMRTTDDDGATAALISSRQIFLHLVEKVRAWDTSRERQLIEAGDYEALDMAIMEHLLGVSSAVAAQA